MNEQTEKARLHVIKTIDNNDEFVREVDGYIYYNPTKTTGFLSSHELRWIADELDLRNKPWNEVTDSFFNSIIDPK